METEVLEIIERFHKAIADSEYSYTDIEKKTGIPRATVQRWATGKTKGLPIEGIKKVCSVIGANAAEILGWTKEKAPSEEGARYADLVKMLDTLPDEALDKVVDYVTMLVQRYS